MKKQICLSIQALFVSALFIISCNSTTDEMEIPLQPEEEKIIQVPIGFSGEILNITDSPLSRSETKDWYAFQVYSAPEDGSQGYSYYAFGFFDNKKDMIINLKEGYKYKFDVCMIVNGSEKVYKFALVNAGWAAIGNSFMISSEEHVRYMYEGYLYMNDNETYDRPNVDRFFGRTTDYVPTDGGSVNINMKRVSFGAKFVAKDFTEGKLEINIEGAPMINLDTNKGNEVEEIVSFNNLERAFSNNDYSESIPVNITWVKTDNVRVPIASEAVEFKRNKLTTIEFIVKESTSSSSFNLNANETMIVGETIEIGGDGTDIGVNPNE